MNSLKGVNKENLDQCVLDSFGGSGSDLESRIDKPNFVLEKMLSEWRDYGTHLYPSVAINGQTFRGTINPINVLEDICASYDREPASCKTWLNKEGI